jgi:hypothetical protein
MDIDKFIGSLDSFDLIFFHGEKNFISYLVELFTLSKISHVGIVIKNPTYIDPKLTGTYLLESGAEDFPDAENGEKKYGVQLVDMKKKLEEYEGDIFYRKVKCNFKHDSRETMMKSIHSEIHGKPYDLCLFDFIRTGLDINVGNTRKTDEFICSTLVAYVYTKLGLLKPDTDWSLLLPKYFDKKSCDMLEFGVTLGERVYLNR